MGGASGVNDGLAAAATQIRHMLDRERVQPVTIGLFGLGGAGKSSLVNALVGKDVMEVGVRNDVQQSMHCIEYNGLKFCDLPGFGTEMFPSVDFESKFEIEKFDVLLCVRTATGVKLLDKQAEFFRRAAKRSRAALFVVTGWDGLKQRGKTKVELESDLVTDTRKHLHSPNLPVFFVSSVDPMYGIDALGQAIWDVLDDAKRERWAKGAKAYSADFLLKKRGASESSIAKYASIAALNALNPIPGLDVAVDFATMLRLFAAIREIYGLSPARLKWLETHAGGAAAQIGQRVAAVAGPMAKEGLIKLLKNYAGREAVKEISKYIPLIGQIVAGGIGFGITYWAGREYLDRCEQLARTVLDENLPVPEIEDVFVDAEVA